MVTVWISHSGGVCRKGVEFTELRFGVVVRVGAAEEVGDNGCFGYAEVEVTRGCGVEVWARRCQTVALSSWW
jgi:hypothetical protein